MRVDVVQNALRIRVDGRSAGQAIDTLLTSQLFLADGFVRSLFSAGRVRAGSVAAVPGDILRQGQVVWLQGGVEEEPLPIPFNNVSPLNVLYEDDHALIANKPAGVLVYPGTPADTDTLLQRVASYYAETGQELRVRHAHRLDRDTTGAVLYAKHEYAARSFDQLLQQGQVHRRYLAVVVGRLPTQQGVIDQPIGRDRHVAGRYRVSATGRTARTHYSVLAVAQVNRHPVSLVECMLETGRTHQIRVHLASLGCPVVGDALYGAPRTDKDLRTEHSRTAVLMTHGHALHAVELRFWHPYEGEWVSQVAPLPQDFVQLLALTGLPPV
ncbi:RluA family pseudouridine synthase [Alicyclobacillus sp. ALC3]|uniref:RluA family pseudouridine synthase n=1 Tax=Alicyclobacillus sp. ALC3 TaxID=2796143 RepID=UPI002378CF86|nr:RluA family pseudouridine synthase [Alicyclobacillus sp. ALC3]WDL98217.1 RluA family pseudouridine synthase [Alicyclobacillus sp. ALC3]